MLTAQDLSIAEAKAEGKSLRQIQTSTGIDHATVHYKLKTKPELKAYIEKLQLVLINKTLSKAVGNIHNVVNNYLKAPDDSRKCDHGFKASIRLMESVGLLPGQAQSIYIQQIYNDNRTEMPESIKELFAAVTHKDQNNRSLLDDGQVIEVDPVK